MPWHTSLPRTRVLSDDLMRRRPLDAGQAIFVRSSTTMKQKTLLASAIAAAIALSSWTAVAQEANSTGQDAAAPGKAKNLETITVTGSRIRSADVETAQPVVALNRQQIEKSGYTTVEQLLTNLPEVSSGLGRATNNNSDSEAGSSTISMRYLGAQRTLVLVNGRRWSSQLDGTTDISSIPVSMIERVEVLKDGASTIYGSDAIAGVVNIITRDHFDGAEVHVNYGKYSQGGGNSKTVDFTAGTHTAKGSFIFSVQHTDSGSVSDSSRGITSIPYYRHPGAGFSSYTDQGTYITPADAAAGGSLKSLSGTINPYNYNQDSYALVPIERNSVYTQYKYEFTPNLAFRSNVAFTQRKTDARLAATPLGIGPDLGTTPYLQDTLLSAQNAYNPTGQDLEVQRRLVEGGARSSENRNNSFHADLGLDGSFDVGDHHFDWDTTYAYDRLNAKLVTDGLVNAANLRNAVGPTFDDNGVIRCGTAGNAIAGCTPVNLLSSRGGLTQDQLDYILYNDRSSFKSTTHDFTANITGNIVPLPAGDLSFAAGYEYRNLKGSFRPDPITEAGLSSGNASLPTQGGYHVNEAYLELSAPILQGLPGAQELTLNASGRYSKYSNFGTTKNYKYGFTWHPISDLLVRGTYADGFRAPTIEDLFQGTSDDFATFNDPCDSVGGAASRSGAVAANCAAHGVPAGYTQPNGYGSQTTQPFKVGGNANLKPETSHSKTLGLVYSPSWLSGLDLSLDWYDIKIRNTIVTLDADTILDQCYRQDLGNFCGLVSRAPNGSITGLNEVGLNIGSVETSGYDFTASYRLPQTAIGNFRFSLDANYVDKYDQVTLNGQKPSHLVGTYEGTPVWRTRANFQVDWSRGPWSAFWRLRYTSGLNEDCVFDDHCNRPDHVDSASGTVRPFNRVGATTYHDIQVGYQLPWKGSVDVGVNNVFNRKPPILYTNSQAISFDPAYYDMPDRYFYVEYRQRF
jgi:iron complex outermembrane receptor protein